jgi:energy-coupling factor transporter ATP-binding protein EcfA2
MSSLYGLGDLSHIMDERAYAQANVILAHLGDGLSTFVITDAFRQSLRAVNEHGFVLLLGEPACGKSTIAGMLAVGALDHLKCNIVKVPNAKDFVDHWNPGNEKQLFWVDDAFGPTQLDWGEILAWNRAFPHVQTAIKGGSKFIFTSRTHIFRMAQAVLKTSALPAIDESQVVIQVEKITRDEKEKILYNHIKMGSQTKQFKSRIKGYLNGVVDIAEFSPETARRLGNRVFTGRLHLSQPSVNYFVSHPIDQLRDTIRTIGNESRSALALVFINGGRIACPLDLEARDRQIVASMGADAQSIGDTLDRLEGSLFTRSLDAEGNFAWKFKHPTIGEAFSAEICHNASFLDIYLGGAKLEDIFREVSCGDLNISGVKLIIPRNRYAALLARIGNPIGQGWTERRAIAYFIANRCDSAFVGAFLQHYPDYLAGVKMRSPISWDPDVRLVAKIHSLGLLEAIWRDTFVERMAQLAIESPDAGCLSDPIRHMFSPEELQQMLDRIRLEIAPNVRELVRDLASNLDEDSDPDDFFSDLKSAFTGFMNEYGADTETGQCFQMGLDTIDATIANWEGKPDQKPHSTDASSLVESPGFTQGHSQRSIFDDVDA